MKATGPPWAGMTSRSGKTTMNPTMPSITAKEKVVARAARAKATAVPSAARNTTGRMSAR
eukprot:3960478-Lingulodinium_polyedra.AAC.1